MKGIPVYKYDLETKDFVKSYSSIAEAAIANNCDESTIRKAVDQPRTAVGYIWSTSFKDNAMELVSDGGKDIMKAKLLDSDIKRLNNSSVRRKLRLENAAETYHSELAKRFKAVNWNYAIPNWTEFPSDNTTCLLVQLSDLHLDELVDHGTYKYNINVASARLKLYRDYIEKYCKAFAPNRIIVAMTGDLISSDKRLDNILMKATNRATASIVATKLLGKFLVDISQFAPVKVVSVVGNESRMSHEMGFNDVTITDNYDYLIHNQLRFLLEGDKNGIKFLNDGSDVEAIVNINGHNILLMHGFSIKGKNDQGAMQSILGKYAARGIIVNYVLFGHVHFANITDLYARSSSLIGGNAYSDRALNFASIASQNIHIIDDAIHSVRVNLDNYKDDNFYSIEDLHYMYSTETSDKQFYSDKKQYFVIPIE